MNDIFGEFTHKKCCKSQVVCLLMGWIQRQWPIYDTAMKVNLFKDEATMLLSVKLTGINTVSCDHTSEKVRLLLKWKCVDSCFYCQCSLPSLASQRKHLRIFLFFEIKFHRFTGKNSSIFLQGAQSQWSIRRCVRSLVELFPWQI